jgi:hypothetical protein
VSAFQLGEDGAQPQALAQRAIEHARDGSRATAVARLEAAIGY